LKGSEERTIRWSCRASRGGNLFEKIAAIHDNSLSVIICTHWLKVI